MFSRAAESLYLNIAQTRSFITRNYSCGVSIKLQRPNIIHTGFEVGQMRRLGHLSLRIWIRYFSARCCYSSSKPAIEENKLFYVVRKGDVVAVFSHLSDCQAQIGSSVCDPSVSVYKGYGLRKEAEEYLTSKGLKNAVYAISSVHVNDELFGTLTPCRFQDPDALASLKSVKIKEATQKSQEEMKELENVAESEGNVISSKSMGSERPLKEKVQVKKTTSGNKHLVSCILEFDGAAKGNPGRGGAGVILRKDDGSVICRLREGLGCVTNNIAEYKAAILGMKYALEKGFEEIHVRGDSKLVCLQISGKWKARHQNTIDLCLQAKNLRDKFLSFQIEHIKRELNTEADAESNHAVLLQEGEIFEDCVEDKA